MTSNELREHTRRTNKSRALAWDNFAEQWVIVWWNPTLETWSTDIVGGGAGEANLYAEDELGAFRELPPDAE